MENLTQTQNKKITSLCELNQKLQVEVEQHDIDIDAMQNIAGNQEDELEEMLENDAALQNKVNEYIARLSTIENITINHHTQFEEITNHTIMLQKFYIAQQERMHYLEETIDRLNVSLQKVNKSDV